MYGECCTSPQPVPEWCLKCIGVFHISHPVKLPQSALHSHTTVCMQNKYNSDVTVPVFGECSTYPTIYTAQFCDACTTQYTAGEWSCFPALTIIVCCLQTTFCVKVQLNLQPLGRVCRVLCRPHLATRPDMSLDVARTYNKINTHTCLFSSVAFCCFLSLSV